MTDLELVGPDEGREPEAIPIHSSMHNGLRVYWSARPDTENVRATMIIGKHTEDKWPYKVVHEEEHPIGSLAPPTQIRDPVIAAMAAGAAVRYMLYHHWPFAGESGGP